MPLLPNLPAQRAAILAVFAAFGVGVGAMSGAMAALTRAVQVDSAGMGLAISIFTVASILVMSTGGALARQVSSRHALLVCLPFYALAELALLTAPGPTLFYVSFAALGLVQGWTDLTMNAEGSAIENDMGRPIFTTFHATLSATMAVTAILASILAETLGTWVPAVLTAAAFAIAWLMVWRYLPIRALALPRPTGHAPLANRLPLILLGLTAGFSMTAEMTAVLWSAKLLEAMAPALAVIAGLGVAFFGVCTALVRFPADRLRAALGDLRLMTISLLVALAGFAGLGLSPSFAVSVAGFAAVGFGTAALVPCIFSLAAGLVPENRAAGIGFVVMVTAIPRMVGPWIFGKTAANLGISQAFGLFTVPIVLALVIVVGLRHFDLLARAQQRTAS